MRMKFMVITFLLLGQLSISQEIDEFIAENLKKNDITRVLPSLDSLIALAHQNSPELKYRDADQKYWKARQRLAQTKWLDYLYLEAVYSYGVFDNLTASQLSGAPQPSQTLFSTEQDRYTVGPSLKIPISAILNRKNTVRSAKAEAEKSRYEKEVDKVRIRELVITRYNGLLKAHRLLFVYGTIVDTYKVQALRAETDYKNGIIPVSEYTRLSQMLNEAIVAHESQKSELSLAVLLLEEVVGIKLNI
ncbi:TolC family protein [Flagellimonas sp. 2504JD4-2]